MVDSRPFQIFEGSNDILYQQITASVLKLMKRNKESNLYRFLKSYSLTKHSADYFKDITDFEVDQKMAQRKLVQLGKALSRIVSMDMVFKLGESGFNSEMISNSLKVVRNEIKTLITSYAQNEEAGVVDDYKDAGSWLSLVKV